MASSVWAHGAVQTELTIAGKLLKDLQDGVPAQSMCSRTPWLQAVYAQLGFFVSWRAPPKQAKDEENEDLYDTVEPAEPVYGAQALEMLWQELLAQKPKALTLQGYSLFGTFRHLLANDIAHELDRRVNALYVADAGGASASSQGSCEAEACT